MFAALLGPVLSAFTGNLLNSVEGVFKDYFQAKITREQLAVELQKAVLAAFASVEKAYAESLTATFDSFMKAATQSKVMQIGWFAVLISQLAVLLWHQIGIPAIVALGIVKTYPPSGSTVDWAYALVALCLGGGAIALRIGPGSTGLASQLKSLVGK